MHTQDYPPFFDPESRFYRTWSITKREYLSTNLKYLRAFYKDTMVIK